MKTETVVLKKKKKKNKKHQSEHIKGEFLSQIGLFQKEWSGWLLLNQTSTSFSSWRQGAVRTAGIVKTRLINISGKLCWGLQWQRCWCTKKVESEATFLTLLKFRKLCAWPYGSFAPSVVLLVVYFDNSLVIVRGTSHVSRLIFSPSVPHAQVQIVCKLCPHVRFPPHFVSDRRSGPFQPGGPKANGVSQQGRAGGRVRCNPAGCCL